MKITDEIREAIQKAVTRLGSQGELAKRACMERSNISKYISGAVATIPPGTWSRLSPHLAPYLPQAPKAPAPEFKPGDVVRLKSGSPAMTIDSLTTVVPVSRGSQPISSTSTSALSTPPVSKHPNKELKPMIAIISHALVGGALILLICILIGICTEN